jgi:hypothetical protein
MKTIVLQLLLLLLSEQHVFYFIFNRIIPFSGQCQSYCSAITVSAAQYTFAFTGSVQQFIIPSGVVDDAIHVDLSGAAGGTDIPYATAGYGARVESNFLLPAGSVLNINVGGMPSGTTGGWNGGGAAAGGFQGAGGGGASDIRLNGASLGNRIVVAGGGGGRFAGGTNCGTEKAGNGGNPTGATGSASVCCSGSFAGGGGASQTSGGSAGNCSTVACVCLVPATARNGWNWGRLGRRRWWRLLRWRWRWLCG